MSFRKLLLFLSLPALAVLAGTPLQERMPLPDSYHDLEYSLSLDGKTAIVIPAAAQETVEYAAERLQRAVKILTGEQWEIARAIPDDARTAIILEAKDAPRRSLDGFSISFEKGSPSLIRITGDNPRSAIYGQETLLQQLEREEDGSFTLRAAEIRDQARLVLRSFAQNRVAHYSDSMLDAYADARLNCIELRDGPPETMHGQFGFQANTPIPLEETAERLAAAHRRGMYVYGVVCCGVEDKDNDAVLAHFQTLIDMKVDGLYLSFDDPGSTGNAVGLVRRIVDLARSSGYDMEDIAFLPPAPDYDYIDTAFDKNMIAEIPELAEARWYFTSAPSLDNDIKCQNIGLHHKRGFWFNWAMGDSPEFLRVYFFNMSYMITPNFSDNANGVDLTEYLEHAPRYIDSAMVWVRGYPEYLAQYFGTWAWNPEAFDSIGARRRSYARLYGIDLVDTAMRHDEIFTRIKAGMRRIGPFNWQQCVWGPCAASQWKMEQIDILRGLQTRLTAEAPTHSLADQELLQDYYLVPMVQCLDWIKLIHETKFPEEIQPFFDRDLKWEREHGREKVYLDYWRGQIEPSLQIIEERFGQMMHTQGYVNNWRQKLNPPEPQPANE